MNLLRSLSPKPRLVFEDDRIRLLCRSERRTPYAVVCLYSCNRYRGGSVVSDRVFRRVGSLLEDLAITSERAES